jgi:hypothetical protein
MRRKDYVVVPVMMKQKKNINVCLVSFLLNFLHFSTSSNDRLLTYLSPIFFVLGELPAS